MSIDHIREFLRDNGLEYSPRKKDLVNKNHPRAGINYIKLSQDYNSNPTYDMIRPTELRENLIKVAMEDYNSSGSAEFTEFEYKFPTCDTVEDLVRDALEFHNISFSPKGDMLMYTNSPDSIRLDDAMDLILCYRDEYVLESNQKDPNRKFFPVDIVKRRINSIIIEMAHEVKNELREKLKYDPVYAQCTDDWLRCIFTNFHVDPSLIDISVVVFKQWMWQVKEYFYKGGKAGVVDPLFINIYGVEQGTGKSFFIKKLGSPFKDFMDCDIKMKHATMDNEMMRFAEMYITFFDELVMGSTSTEYIQTVAGFKRILTATEFNPRMLYTQKQLKMPRIFSGISATNAPMIDTIYDDTGMRRFFEIPVNTSSSNNTVIDIIRQLPAEAMWKGIDENLVGGYVPRDSEPFKQMRTIQDGYKKGDLLDLVLNHACVMDIDYPLAASSETGLAINQALMENPSLKDADIERIYKVRIVPSYMFRKNIVEWLDDNMGPGQSKYVKNNQGLFHQIQKKGYLVIEKGNSQKVVCTTEEVKVGFLEGGEIA